MILSLLFVGLLMLVGSLADPILPYYFVVTTFVYNPTRVRILEHVLTGISTWRPKANVTVIVYPADRAPFMRRTLRASPMLAGMYANDLIHFIPHESATLDATFGYGHRKLMEDTLSNEPHIQAFSYLEDDMYVTSDNIRAWMSDTKLMDADPLARGFIRAFYRYETRDEVNCLADFQRPNLDLNKCDTCIQILSGRKFIRLKSMYSAFFILTRPQLRELKASPCWSLAYNASQRYPTGWHQRERTSAGLQFCRANRFVWPSRALIPLEKPGALDPSAGVLHLTNKYSERNPANRISCKAREDNWELPASGYKHDPGSPEDDTLDPTLSVLMQGTSRVRFRPGIDGLPGSTTLGGGGGGAPRRKKTRGSGPAQVRPKVDLSQFEEEGSDTRILPPGVDDDSATTQVLDRARVAASVLSSKDLDGEANDRAIASAMLETNGAQEAEGGGGGMSLDAQGGVGLAGGGGGGGAGGAAAAGDLDAGIEAASLDGGMEALNALGGRDLGDPAER